MAMPSMLPNHMNKLNPNYITGLTDGEGWFGVSLAHHNEMGAKYQVSLNFGLAMNCRDSQLIYKIKNYFNCGIVTIKRNGMAEYRVRKFADVVDKIIPFFDKHKLQSEKRKDFEHMKIVANIMMGRKHLTEKGIDFVRAIKSNMHAYSSATL